MILILIISIIVVTIIWFINDKNLQYAAKPTSIPKPKPNVPINNSLVGLGGRTREPINKKTGTN